MQGVQTFKFRNYAIGFLSLGKLFTRRFRSGSAGSPKSPATVYVPGPGYHSLCLVELIVLFSVNLRFLKLDVYFDTMLFSPKFPTEPYVAGPGDMCLVVSFPNRLEESGAKDGTESFRFVDKTEFPICCPI